MDHFDRGAGLIPGAFPVENIEENPIQFHELPASIPQNQTSNLSHHAGPVEWYLPKLRASNEEIVESPDEAMKNPSKKGNQPTTHAGGRIAKGPLTKDGKPVVSKRIMIAVFGLTGTGKSSFISKLTGQDLEIGHGLKSCTSEMQEITFRLGSRNVTMIDTPGFDDTHRTDIEVLREIADWMENTYDQKIPLAGVIYLHRITDVRMTGTSLKNLRLLRKLCGTRSLGNLILASTMWDKLQEVDGVLREKELLDEDKFWGQLKANGANVWRYKNTQEDAIAMVDILTKRSPVFIKIQRELGEQKKTLLETSAGQSVIGALDELKQKHIKDIEEIRQEIALDRTKYDYQLQEELRELHKKVEEVEESKRILAMPRTRRKWWQRSWRCAKCRVRLTKDKDDPEEGNCPGCGYPQRFV